MDNTSESDLSPQVTWHVESIPCPGLDELISRWCIDTPKQGAEVVEDAALNITGWALSNEEQQSHLHLILRFRDRTQSLAFNVNRTDVVKNVLKTEDAALPYTRCGFDYSVAMEDAIEDFEIGFEANGYIYTVAKVFVA